MDNEELINIVEQRNKKKELYEITTEDIEIVLNDDMIKNIHILRSIEGNFLLFNRKNKSFCKLCNEEHNSISENIYCLVTEIDIRLYCRKFDKKNMNNNKYDFPSIYIILYNKNDNKKFINLKNKYENISYRKLLYLLDENNIKINDLKNKKYINDKDTKEVTHKINELKIQSDDGISKNNINIKYTYNELIKWKNSINDNYSINPKTNRKIKINGNLHRNIQKQYNILFHDKNNV